MTPESKRSFKVAFNVVFRVPTEVVKSNNFYGMSLGDLGFDIIKIAQLEEHIYANFKIRIYGLTKKTLVGEMIEMIERDGQFSFEHRTDMLIWSIVRALVFKNTKEKSVMEEDFPHKVPWLQGTFTHPYEQPAKVASLKQDFEDVLGIRINVKFDDTFIDLYNKVRFSIPNKK